MLLKSFAVGKSWKHARFLRLCWKWKSYYWTLFHLLPPCFVLSISVIWYNTKILFLKLCTWRLKVTDNLTKDWGRILPGYFAGLLQPQVFNLTSLQGLAHSRCWMQSSCCFPCCSSHHFLSVLPPSWGHHRLRVQSWLLSLCFPYTSAITSTPCTVIFPWLRVFQWYRLNFSLSWARVQ